MKELTRQVASIEAEITTLRTRAASDEKMISLLKHQNSSQAEEIARMSYQHNAELRALRHERDIAVRKATEVSGVLDQAAASIMDGLRKMRNNEAPSSFDDDDDVPTSGSAMVESLIKRLPVGSSA